MIDLNKLAEIGTIKKCAEDQYIFKEGEPGHEMYIILKGKVDVFLTSYNGYCIKITELSAGSFFGEMSLLEELPRSATIVAVTDTLLLAITKKNFEAFLSSQPAMAYSMLKSLSSRIRNLNHQLTQCRDLPGRLKDTKGTLEEETLDVAAGTLFPEGHKSYSAYPPASHESFLFGAHTTCPVCSKQMEVQMQRLSKLKLDRVDDDLRYRYMDFDPLWHSIWLCPNCYYANYYHDFETLPSKAVLLLRGKTSERLDNYPMRPKGRMDINHVFFKYYAALDSAQAIQSDSLLPAKLWMNISWLYQDMGDEEMHAYAAKQAFDRYLAAYNDTKLAVTPEQEQQLNYILGDLLLRQGSEADALRHFHAAIQWSGGKRDMNLRAQERIQQINNREP